MIVTPELVRRSANNVQKFWNVLAESPLATTVAGCSVPAFKSQVLILIAYLCGHCNTDDISERTMQIIMTIFMFSVHTNQLVHFKNDPKACMLIDVMKALMHELFVRVIPALAGACSDIPAFNDAMARFAPCSDLIKAHAVAFNEYHNMKQKRMMAALLAQALNTTVKRTDANYKSTNDAIVEIFRDLTQDGYINEFETEYADLVYDCKMHGIYPK